jgi:hypothetical protein
MMENAGDADFAPGACLRASPLGGFKHRLTDGLWTAHVKCAHVSPPGQTARPAHLQSLR